MNLFKLFWFKWLSFEDISCEDLCFFSTPMKLNSTSPVVLKVKKQLHFSEDLIHTFTSEVPYGNYFFCIAAGKQA